MQSEEEEEEVGNYDIMSIHSFKKDLNLHNLRADLRNIYNSNTPDD